jgi:uncharacterized protein YndB with AHSA1/START domain
MMSAANDNNNKTKTTAQGRDFIVERTFAAPRQRVFEAWSKPEYLTQWWGPAGWTLPVCKMDFRPGGVWHYCMKGPGGEESWGKAVYHEIVAPERIVYSDYFSDAEGNENDQMPVARITMEFIEQDGHTKLVSRTQYPTPADLEKVMQMGMVEGMTEMLDRFDEYLAKA